MKPGHLDAEVIGEITGLEPETEPGMVVKVSRSRSGHYRSTEIGGSMGLTTWAAFVGSDERASIDGDFIMTADQVQVVIASLRQHRLHVVALHNHMIGEEPRLYFLHYWGKGPAAELARAFAATLEAQAKAAQSS